MSPVAAARAWASRCAALRRSFPNGRSTENSFRIPGGLRPFPSVQPPAVNRNAGPLCRAAGSGGFFVPGPRQAAPKRSA